MTRSSDDARPGVKVVRRKLADGSLKTYAYEQRPKARSRALESGRAIHDLAHAYTKSPEFRGVSERWRAATIYYLGIIEQELGWMALRDIADPRSRTAYYELRDKFAGNPTKSDHVIGILRALLGWAYERRLITSHHAQGIPRLSRTGQRARITWSDEQISTLLAHTSTEMGHLVRFALLSAARISDIRALRWDDYRDGWLTYTPAKTSTMDPPPIVRLPVFELPPLAELLAEIPRASAHIFTTGRGRVPWTNTNYGNRWHEAMARSGLRAADLHFHDLRGTCITRLLEAGCTDAETASISGHTLGGRSTLRAYAARTDAMAISAYRKYAAWLAERPTVVRFPLRRKTSG